MIAAGTPIPGWFATLLIITGVLYAATGTVRDIITPRPAGRPAGPMRKSVTAESR